MWVSDLEDSKIYAYNLATKNPDPSRDISLDQINSNPTGICSDGANIWIADDGPNNSKIYSYKLAANSIDCREKGKDFDTLKAVGKLQPKAIFSDGTTMYVADSADGKIYAYNQPLSRERLAKNLDDERRSLLRRATFPTFQPHNPLQHLGG